MRDPATRFDVEAAIEDTRRFLEHYVQSESWKADSDNWHSPLRATAQEVKGSNLPDWAKTFARLALFEQMEKRRRPGKPKRNYRNIALGMAASRLVKQGYKPTRNDETRNRASAASIIHKALRRLGEKTTEKQINAVVLKYSSNNPA
jgi:hypothetical protein